mmetsp:Transcript_32700/g.77415  ORF Transcript_32700/g.77415 Transcript_32700/m.77415 type:complete len:471 (-) Transcript_32700:108-1520(-)
MGAGMAMIPREARACVRALRLDVCHLDGSHGAGSIASPEEPPGVRDSGGPEGCLERCCSCRRRSASEREVEQQEVVTPSRRVMQDVLAAGRSMRENCRTPQLLDELVDDIRVSDRRRLLVRPFFPVGRSGDECRDANRARRLVEEIAHDVHVTVDRCVVQNRHAECGRLVGSIGQHTPVDVCVHRRVPYIGPYVEGTPVHHSPREAPFVLERRGPHHPAYARLGHRRHQPVEVLDELEGAKIAVERGLVRGRLQALVSRYHRRCLFFEDAPVPHVAQKRLLPECYCPRASHRGRVEDLADHSPVELSRRFPVTPPPMDRGKMPNRPPVLVPCVHVYYRVVGDSLEGLDVAHQHRMHHRTFQQPLVLVRVTRIGHRGPHAPIERSRIQRERVLALQRVLHFLPADTCQPRPNQQTRQQPPAEAPRPGRPPPQWTAPVASRSPSFLSLAGLPSRAARLLAPEGTARHPAWPG